VAIYLGGGGGEAVPLLSEFLSREPVELPEGVEKRLRFSGAIVRDPTTGRLVTIRGPVDLSKYETFEMTLTSPDTGLPIKVQGFTLLVSEEDGIPTVDKPLNIVSKRLAMALAADLKSGDYLKRLYRITAIEERPKTRYQVVVE
jgi:hypothetical protein